MLTVRDMHPGCVVTSVWAGTMGGEVTLAGRSDSAAVASRVAAAFGRLPGVVAVALGGSRSVATMDDRSDLDLYVYARTPIPLGSRRVIAAQFARDAPEIGNAFWEPGDEWTDAATGIAVDLIYRDPGWIEEQLARVLVRHEASLGYTTSLWFNVLHSVALADPGGWYQWLQSTATVPYPEPLRRAIVAKNQPVLRQRRSSYLHQIELALHRDDRFSVQHRLTAFLASYFDVLFALNRQPHPGEKRLLPFTLTHCPLRPPAFEERIPSVLADQTPAVAGRLHSLVDDLDGLLAAEGLLPWVLPE